MRADLKIPSFPEMLSDAVKEALNQETLVDALLYICLWSNDVNTRQISYNLKFGHQPTIPDSTYFNESIQTVVKLWGEKQTENEVRYHDFAISIILNHPNCIDFRNADKAVALLSEFLAIKYMKGYPDENVKDELFMYNHLQFFVCTTVDVVKHIKNTLSIIKKLVSDLLDVDEHYVSVIWEFKR